MGHRRNLVAQAITEANENVREVNRVTFQLYGLFGILVGAYFQLNLKPERLIGTAFAAFAVLGAMVLARYRFWHLYHLTEIQVLQTLALRGKPPFGEEDVAEAWRRFGYVPFLHRFRQGSFGQRVGMLSRGAVSSFFLLFSGYSTVTSAILPRAFDWNGSTVLWAVLLWILGLQLLRGYVLFTSRPTWPGEGFPSSALLLTSSARHRASRPKSLHIESLPGGLMAPPDELDPWTTDSGNDGLSDAEEVLEHGTDPQNPDTDNDGYADGEEVAAGTDPLDPHSKPDS